MKPAFAPFSKYGSPIDLSTTYLVSAELPFLRRAEAVLNAMFAWHARSVNDMPVQFAFTDARFRQAFAGRRDQQHVVGITLEHALVFRHFARTALAHQGILDRLLPGGSAASRPQPVPDPTSYTSYAHNLPNPPKAATFADLIATYCLLTVAAHELGHIHLGHLETAGSATFSMDARTTSTDTSGEAQAMEYVADLYAANVILDFTRSFKTQEDLQPDALLRWLLIALHSTFRLDFSTGTWSVNLHSGMHPVSQVRQVSMSTQLIMRFTESDLLSEVEARGIAPLSFEDAEVMYELVKGSRRDVAQKPEYAALAGSIHSYRQEMLRQHRELHPNVSIP